MLGSNVSFDWRWQATAGVSIKGFMFSGLTLSIAKPSAEAVSVGGPAYVPDFKPRYLHARMTAPAVNLALSIAQPARE